MARGAGLYAPLMDEMSKQIREGQSSAGESTPGTSAGGGPAAGQRLADAMRTGTSAQENRGGSSPDIDAAGKLRSAMEQGTSAGEGPAAGQRLSDAMKPKPGNYVWSDVGNADAGGEQYHYNVNEQGVVQYTSPITGKKVTLRPDDTAPHKQRAYQAIIKQIAKAQAQAKVV